MTNPTLISVPFANGGNKNTIQTTRQAGQDAQDATWTDGFPSITMTPIRAGGLPPKGLDFNGIFYALSDNVVHRLKGLSVQFSATYATAIGGYPVGSKLELNDGSAIVISTVGNNMTDPNSSMTGWAYYSGSASIVNTLTSTDATRPLSAAQGKVLNDSKLNITDFQKQTAIISAASGTADAITASYTPAITALTNGMSLFVRATSANATTTPTFTPNSGKIAEKTIVKGAGSALVAGDIAGGGHWIELQYDVTLDRWVLLNPATGVTTIQNASTTQAGIVQLVNDLTTGGTNKALTAQQGVILNNRAFGVEQTWQDFTSSRVLNTIYTNSTGKPICIAVNTNTDDNNMSLYINEVLVTFVGSTSSSPGDSYHTITGIIPAGSTYRVTVGSGTMSKWSELR